MAELVPYLGFGGNAREVMQFYHGIFGGELKIQSMGESPMAAMFPAEVQNNVLHSVLQSDAIHMYASDMSDPAMLLPGEKVSLCIVCMSKEELDTFYAKLSEGGKAEHPPKEEFFGTFGDLVDKYGFRWMVQFGMGGDK
ncbi:MAG: VOC family protein [bacterium]|nr:VOC family protein [bacterium]